MKPRIFLSIFFIYFLPASVFSQLNDRKTATYLGIKAGPNLNLTRWKSDAYKEFHTSKWQVGFQTGFVAVFENRNKYAIQAELLYSMKRKKIVSTDFDWDENKATYHYIDFPVLFRRKFDHKTFQWYFGLGPQLGFWLGGKGTFTIFDESAQFNVPIDYEVNFGDSQNPDFLNEPEAEKVQISFIGTIGFLFPISDSDIIGFDIRYDWGHSFMGSRDKSYMSRFSFNDNFQGTNNVLSISFIYLFDTFLKSNPRR